MSEPFPEAPIPEGIGGFLPAGFTLEWRSLAPEPECALRPAEMARFERKLQRMICRAFRVKPHHIGLGVPRLAIDGHKYRQRQRNRVKRRKR